MGEPGWDNYTMGATAYGAFAFMGLVTLMWVAVELGRRKTISYLNRGYYFLEEYYGQAKKRWIPIPPSNIDASDPMHPRIINPALVDRDACFCCM